MNEIADLMGSSRYQHTIFCFGMKQFGHHQKKLFTYDKLMIACSIFLLQKN